MSHAYIITTGTATSLYSSDDVLLGVATLEGGLYSVHSQLTQTYIAVDSEEGLVGVAYMLENNYGSVEHEDV